MHRLRLPRDLPPARHPMAGFTLIELMVTLTVIAVLGMVAVPSFNQAFLSNRLTGYANSFAASATYARSEAIKRNTTVTLCSSGDGAACASSGGWQQGWIVLAGTTVLQKQAALASGYHFTGDNSSIVFQPTGVGATDSTLVLCRATPSAGNQERQLRVTATGRVNITKTTLGTCA